MSGKIGRPPKYSNEENAILNKCKIREVYNTTKTLLGLTQD